MGDFDAAAAVVATARKQLRQGVQFPGTVVSFDEPYAVVTLVDGSTVYPTSLLGVGETVSEGDRVMVEFVPPRGVFISSPPFA